MAALLPLMLPAGPPGLGLLVPHLIRALDGTGPPVAPLPDPQSHSAAYLNRLLGAIRPEDAVADDIAAVVATSGSTGDPAGVELPRDALLAAADGFSKWRHGQPDRPGPDRLAWLAALPLHSIGGLMALVRSLRDDLDPVPTDWLGGARPFAAADFLAASSQFGAAGSHGRAVSLVPTMLQRIVTSGLPWEPVLAGYDVILIGGARAEQSLLDKLRRAGCHPVTSYGMTETAGGCVFNSHPIPGVRVWAERSGRLVVSGPVVGRGYRDGRDPQDWLPGSEPGVRAFRTQDRGAIGPDGSLVVLGRSDEVVQVGGINVDLAAVEGVLSDGPGIEQAAVVAISDPTWGSRVVAFVTCASPPPGSAPPGSAPPGSAPSDPPSAQDDVVPGRLTDGAAAPWRAMVAEQVGRAGVPRMFIRLSALPRLPGGKVDRIALRQQAAELIRDGGQYVGD